MDGDSAPLIDGCAFTNLGAAPYAVTVRASEAGATVWRWDLSTGTPGACNASNSTRRQSRAHRTPQIAHVRFLHDWPSQPRRHRSRSSPALGGIVQPCAGRTAALVQVAGDGHRPLDRAGDRIVRRAVG